MTVSAIVVIVLAVVLLAYVLEPIIRARVDRVEVDATVQAPPVPDFRSLLEEESDPSKDQETEETRQPAPNPEPAEHRS